MSQCIEQSKPSLNVVYYYNSPVQGAVNMGNSSTFFKVIQTPPVKTSSSLFNFKKEGFSVTPSISDAVRYPFYGKGCKYAGVC